MRRGSRRLTGLAPNVYSDNAAAIALYRKFGFMVEGTHHRYALRDGVLVYSLTIARLRQ